jgi:hypothetical protein
MTLDLRTHESVTHTHAPMETRTSLGERLVSAFLSIGANARLQRAARRHRSRGSPPVPAWLRQDLGLPEIIEPEPYHWHHP